MKRDQTFHEILIPLLVSGMGAQSYLEFGTHQNETISKVSCAARYGVDPTPVEIPGIEFFRMSTIEFLRDHARRLAPFDFVFIDADHSAQAVETDFHGVWPHVSPDGLVCLHDLNPETPTDAVPGFCDDGWKFTPMLVGKFEAIVLPYHPGLAIVRKRGTWGPKA